MNELKRIISYGIVMFFMTVIGLMGVKDEVSAAEFADAVNIPLNGSAIGNTEEGSYYEQDYYKFTVTTNGYVALNFRNPLQKNSDTYWKMYLYNPDYDEICVTNISGANTSTNSTLIGVTAGTYYIKVNSVGYSYASSTDIYSIIVNFTSSEVWEKEFNENFVDSTPMQTGQTYYGTTRDGHNYEKDYYSFSLAQNGCIKINFSNPLQENSKDYWKIYVYNSQYQGLYSQMITGNQAITTLPVIGIPAGKYYLKIESAGYTTAASTDIYGVKVDYQASDLWEQELNDDFTSANSINLESQYSGATLQGNNYEKDFFKFNISSSGLYSIGLTTPNLYDGDSYWMMYLYDSSYQELGKRTIYGNKTYHSISQALAVGTYYVKVMSAGYSSPASKETYQLKVTTTTKAEMQANCDHKYQSTYIRATYFKKGYSLHKCEKCGKVYKDNYVAKKKLGQGSISIWSKGGKGKLHLQWYMVTDASGYEIRYCKRKNMKKSVKTKMVKGGSKSKKTIKGLSRKKKYYVQIRAYKKSGSKIVYGKWSTKRCLRTK